MAIVTWWSLYSPLKRNSFNQIKIALIFYSAFHFLFLFSYQIPVVQYYIDENGFIARLIGLTPLVTNSCEKYWTLTFTNAAWTQFSNFFLIAFFYHVLIWQYNWTKYGIRQVQRDNDSSVHEEVIFDFTFLHFPTYFLWCIVRRFCA
jgi:hypothetical protein